MAANLPIIRPKREGGPEFLLRLVVTHPDGMNPPSIECNWDGEWVTAHSLPPAFPQQVFLGALQILFASALMACGNVTIVPPATEQPKPN
jgi:hypothetical protein